VAGGARGARSDAARENQSRQLRQYGAALALACDSAFHRRCAFPAADMGAGATGATTGVAASTARAAGSVAVEDGAETSDLCLNLFWFSGADFILQTGDDKFQ
jgi:hypothetical protein